MSRTRVLGLGIYAISAALFLLGCSSPAAEESPPEQLPTEPLGAGDEAPDFSLPDADGNMVSLADQLRDHRLTVLVFYHAYN